MDKNYIKQKVGLLSAGNNTIEHSLKLFTDDFCTHRDIKLFNLIKNVYNNVLIIGDFPLILGLLFKCNVTFLDNSKMLEIFRDQIKKYFNIDTILINPMFNNISKIIKNYDLIIYHDSENLVPLDLLPYTHYDKDVFVANTFMFYHKINNNLAYNEHELFNLYPMKKIYDLGRIKLPENKHTFYCYGKIND